MIPAQFIQIEKIPLTPNGKLDRRALPDPEPLTATNYTAPRDTVERKLAEIWSEILEMPKEIISIDSDFFQLGGHSMKAIRLVALANRENFNVSFAEVIKYNTIAGLAGHINTKKQENGNSTVLPGSTDDAENMAGKNPGFQPDIYSDYFPCILGSLREKFKYEHQYEICKGVLLAADGKTLMALGSEKNSGIKEKLALLGYPYSELCGFKSIPEIFGYTMQLKVFSSLEEEIAYCRETINQKKLALLTGTTYFLNYTPDYLLDRAAWLNKMDQIFQGYNESQKGKLIGHTFMLADIIGDYYILYDSTYNYYGRVPADNFHKAIKGNSAIECSRGHVSYEAYLPYQVFQVDSANLNRPDMKEMIFGTLKKLVEITVSPKVLQREINSKEYYAYFGLAAIKEFGRVIEQGIENKGEYDDLFVYADNIVNSWKYKHIYLRDFLLDFRNFFPIHSEVITDVGKVINSWHILLEKIQKKKDEKNSIPGFLEGCVKEIGNIYIGHEVLFEKLKEHCL
jgi:acyl carrier protein